jgi:HEAT repeat protein
MKNILKSIFNFFKTPPEIKYAGKSIYDIQIDIRSQKKYSLEELLDSLKEIENIPSEEKLSQENILNIFFESENMPSLCFSSYIVTKLENIDKEKVVEKFIQFLNHENETLRRIAGRALLKVEDIKGLNAVIGGHNHGHAVRTEASWVIAKMDDGTKAKEAIPGLIKLIEYKKINYRSHWAAVSALANIGEPAKEILLKNLDSKDKSLRYYSAMALSELKPEPIMNSKIKYIRDNDL